MESQCVDVRPSPGKGNGVFVVSQISPGTTVCAERKVLIIAKQQPSEITDQDVRQAFDKLSRAQRKQYLELHEGHQRPGETRKDRIYRANCLGSGGKCWMAFCLSRINHSCVPNATVRGDDSVDAEVSVVVEKPVLEGEKILVNYKPLIIQPMVARTRQQLLHLVRGFVWACSACAQTGDALAPSDMRRQLINGLLQPLRGARPFAFNKPDRKSSRDGRYAALECSTSDLPCPLSLRRLTAYQLLLAKVQEAEGIELSMIAASYQAAACFMHRQTQSYRGELVLQSSGTYLERDGDAGAYIRANGRLPVGLPFAVSSIPGPDGRGHETPMSKPEYHVLQRETGRIFRDFSEQEHDEHRQHVARIFPHLRP
ncbi:SET domain-containing protein 5 [Teratosphaeriaceae sp. CCFEE 6253]|nr:SET domain-containing protein 5 [Teratosphaeriaceae sp. CCFEE 6253]